MARATRYKVAVYCGNMSVSRYYTNDYDDAERIFYTWKKDWKKYMKKNKNINVFIDDSVVDNIILTAV